MPPVFGPWSPSRGALEVLRRAERHRPAAVAEREERDLGPSSSSSITIASPSAARLRSAAVELVVGAADEDALARREPVGLDDARRRARLASTAGVGTPGGAPSRPWRSSSSPRSARRPAPGPKTAMPAWRSSSRDAGDERRLGPDHDEVDGQRASRARAARRRRRRAPGGSAERRDPGVPRRRVQLGQRRARARLSRRAHARARPSRSRSTFTRRVYSGRFRNDHRPGGGRFPDGVALPISVATLFPTRGQPLGARAAAFRCVPVPGKRTFSSDVTPAARRDAGRSGEDALARGADADQLDRHLELALDELDVPPRRLGQLVAGARAVERLSQPGSVSQTGRRGGSRSGAPGSAGSRSRRAGGSGRRPAARRSPRGRRASSARAT